MKQIILNADDFGLATAIDEAVLDAARLGCLTSASLCTTGPTAVEAANCAAELPELSVGLHLTLVDERPAAAVATIPSLVDDRGRLPRSGMEFARLWSSGRILAADVEREVAAQWQRAVDLGVSLTHFDAHDHIHILPGVLEICLREAKRRGVRRLRIPLESQPIGAATSTRRFLGLCLRALARRAMRVAAADGFVFPAAFSGFRGAGSIDASSLVNRIAAAGPGVTEIALHPATTEPPRADMYDWGYHWREEYLALKDRRVCEALTASAAELISFGDLQVAQRRAV